MVNENRHLIWSPDWEPHSIGDSGDPCRGKPDHFGRIIDARLVFARRTHHSDCWSRPLQRPAQLARTPVTEPVTP